MSAQPPRRPADRDRAVDRFRHLTVGTAVAGIVAVGGFGGLAAVSYRGADAGVTTAAVTTTTSGDTTSGATSGTSSTSDDTTTSTTSSDSTGSAASAPTPTATTPSVTSTTGPAHATSGGS